MSHEPHVLVLPDPAAVAEAGARLWVDAQRHALDVRGAFHVALAGGRTPEALYRAVARQPDLDSGWHRVHVWFGDERAVHPDDPRSNYRAAREALLDDVPLSAGQVHRMEGEADDLDAAARRYEESLRAGLGGTPALDLVWLGIGSDGHTASLFPGSPTLAETARAVVAVEEPAAHPPRRLTLTLPVLSAAHRVVFVATGTEKAAIVARLLGGQDGGRDLPAARVRPGPGGLAWLLDADAASRLARATR